MAYQNSWALDRSCLWIEDQFNKQVESLEWIIKHFQSISKYDLIEHITGREKETLLKMKHLWHQRYTQSTIEQKGVMASDGTKVTLVELSWTTVSGFQNQFINQDT